jgi:hypothetical protein
VRPLALLLLFGAAALALGDSAAPADDKKDDKPVDVQKDVYPFLRKHCVSCHNDVTGTAEPSLTHFQTADAIHKDADAWRLVLKTIAIGTMPPAGRPKPAKKDVDGFTRNGNRALERAERE